MAKKIYQAICLVAALVLVLSSAVLTAVLYSHFTEQTQRELQVEAVYIAHGLDLQGEPYLDTLGDRTRRITHIAADGTVLFDNEADVASMENHLDREEVRQALETGTGTGSRTSRTLAQDTFYYAKRLPDGSVLRLAATQRSVWVLLVSVLQPVAVVILLVLILGAVLAHQVSARIVAPINSLDLEHPEQNQVYEEVSPLLSSIARLRRTIDRQLADARQKQQEFRLITEHMSEGLLVIDGQTNLLSCNGAALALLHGAASPEPVSVLALNRSEAFRTAVRESLEGRHWEGQLEVGGRTLQLMANPVRQGEEVTGAVLLVVDITERAQREALRREFSANVSHELKTPLTSISGYAELIETGMASDEDVVRFARGIHNSANRLLTLINDIIRLSELDSGEAEEPFETLNLFELAENCTEMLQMNAEKHDVKITAVGEEGYIKGNRQMVEELLYNLCDNAIRYNNAGGSVTVSVKREDAHDCGHVILSVKDTGIGIPEEHRERIFERFYRVDKSRSKSTGGTGLGLAIVKHIVAKHDAVMELDSEVGRGTEIRVIFREVTENCASRKR